MTGRRVRTALAGLLLLAAGVGLVAAASGLADGLGYNQGLVTAPAELAASSLLLAILLVTASGAAELFLDRGALGASALAVVALTAEAAILERWTVTPPAVGAVAHGIAPLVVPALFDLATVGKRRFHRLRVGVWCAFGACGAILIFFRETALDPLCVGACAANPMAVASAPDLIIVVRWFMAVLAGCLTAVASAAWRRRQPGRMATASAILALMVCAAQLVAEAAWASALTDALLAPSAVWSTVLLLLAAAHLVDVSTVARRRSAVERLVTPDLGNSDEAVLDGLLAALSEPSARAAFPHTDGSLVDARGRETDATGVRVLIYYGDEVVTVLTAPIPLDDRIAAQISPTVGLMLANVRDRARIRAVTRELEESRRRIVDAGDDTRRTVERDLHDGAQQTLLSLQYELALVGTPEALEQRRQAARIGEKLRSIAHGAFPMVLDDIGLEAALRRLADEADIPLEASVVMTSAPSRAVARTAYLLGIDLVAAGGRASAHVDVRQDDGNLIVTAIGGPPSPGTLDRIDALGGRIERQDDRTRAVLPCALS